MKKSVFLLLFLSSFWLQACDSANSTQAEDVRTSITEVSISSTPDSLPSFTPTPLSIEFENLKTIDSVNISSLVKLDEFQLIDDYAIALYWSSDSKEIHILKSNGGIEFWNVEIGQIERRLKSTIENAYSIGWNPVKNLVAFVDKTTTNASVWDLESNRFLFSLGMHTYPFINAQSVSWAPDNTKIVSAGWDNTLRVWDASTGKELNVIKNDSSWFESTSWSPDGRYIAVGHKKGSVHIIETEQWRIVKTFSGHNSGHEGGVPTVSWSPDGTKIASGGRDEHRVIVWGFFEEAMVYQLEDQPLSVFGLNWSPDKKMIASSGEGGDVVITDTTTGAELIRLGKHKPNTYCVSWSPNGKLLATISADGVIRIWGIRP